MRPNIRFGPIVRPDEHGRYVQFNPTGQVFQFVGSDQVAEYSANPEYEDVRDTILSGKPSHPTQAARFLVGMNVGEKKVWTPQDIFSVFYVMRESQLFRDTPSGQEEDATEPGFTMFAGLGSYGAKGEAVVENSVQIAVLNVGQERDTFFDQMAELAAICANILHQHSILVELQEDGRVFYQDFVNGWKDPAKAVVSKVAEVKALTREFLRERVKSGKINLR